MMKGLLLVNMGGAKSQNELRFFLNNMFKDPYILPFPKISRYCLAWLISFFRHKDSWKKYEKIGGTPIFRSTERLCSELKKDLNEDYCIDIAYSYSNPLIIEKLKEFSIKNIKELTIVPLYPHYSFCTNKSVADEVDKISTRLKLNSVSFAESLSNSKYFTNYWVSIIDEHIKNHKIKKPLLLFTAHAIPEYWIKKGDNYMKEVEKSAITIAKQMSLPYKVGYQSRIGKTKWTKPDTKLLLKELSPSDLDNDIILIPISFISENLETLYDLNIDIIPYAKKIGINNISRADIPEFHPLMIKIIMDVANINSNLGSVNK